MKDKTSKLQRTKENLANKIKQQQNHLRQIEYSKNEVDRLQREINTLQTMLTEQVKNTTILNITDHAFVRWLERVKGVPVEKFKREALASLPKHLVDGVHSFGGFNYIVKDNLLITITCD